MVTSKVDPRIHFTLNCGAKGCPPIRVYEKEKLEYQLNMATTAFMVFGTKFIEKNKKVVLELSELLKWYLVDFGGKEGLKKFLRKHQ